MRGHNSSRQDHGSSQDSIENLNRRFGSSFTPRPEMHKAKCADCGAECEVPFVPKEGRPVFCRACYPKHAKPRY